VGEGSQRGGPLLGVDQRQFGGHDGGELEWTASSRRCCQ
jgi:hypothetical protein